MFKLLYHIQGYDVIIMIRIIRTPKGFHGTKKDMKLAQGYNNITNEFFIYITDKKSKITLRINMDEEHFQNFHNMGNMTFRQTKKDVEFEEDNDCNCEHNEPVEYNDLD